jgi:hypothetical protein
MNCTPDRRRVSAATNFFPVFFPDTREIFRGDRFDGDFVRHHAFRLPMRFPGHPVITAQLADLLPLASSLLRVCELFRACFVAFVSAHKIRFPGNRDFSSKRHSSNAGQLLSQGPSRVPAGACAREWPHLMRRVNGEEDGSAPEVAGHA